MGRPYVDIKERPLAAIGASGCLQSQKLTLNPIAIVRKKYVAAF